MLVLTRKVDERINIGDDIVVSVLEIETGHRCPKASAHLQA